VTNDDKLDISNGILLDKVVSSAIQVRCSVLIKEVTGRVTNEQKCMEKVPRVFACTNRIEFSLKLKGKVYTSCVNCLIYGTNTRPYLFRHNEYIVIIQVVIT